MAFARLLRLKTDVVTSSRTIILPSEVIEKPDRREPTNLCLLIGEDRILTNRELLYEKTAFFGSMVNFKEDRETTITLRNPYLNSRYHAVYEHYFTAKFIAAVFGGLYLEEPRRTAHYDLICLYNTKGFLMIVEYFGLQGLDQVTAKPEKLFMNNEEAMKYYLAYNTLRMAKSMRLTAAYLADNILRDVSISYQMSDKHIYVYFLGNVYWKTQSWPTTF